MARYSLLIKASASKELETIDRKEDRRRIVGRIRSLSDGPRPSGCEKLSGHHDKCRIREGSYRIVYLIDDDALTVTIIKIGHRKDVYREL